MNDSDKMNMSAQIECARVFDRKLLEVRRIVCEPSRLGGGTRARTSIEMIKNEAESLQECVTRISEALKSVMALKESNMSVIQSWMDESSSQIEPLEAKGREAGLIQDSCADESAINSATVENGLPEKPRISNSYENGLHPGRKSISRRLFESIILTPASSARK